MHTSQFLAWFVTASALAACSGGSTSDGLTDGGEDLGLADAAVDEGAPLDASDDATVDSAMDAAAEDAETDAVAEDAAIDATPDATVEDATVTEDAPVTLPDAAIDASADGAMDAETDASTPMFIGSGIRVTNLAIGSPFAQFIMPGVYTPITSLLPSTTSGYSYPVTYFDSVGRVRMVDDSTDAVLASSAVSTFADGSNYDVIAHSSPPVLEVIPASWTRGSADFTFVFFNFTSGETAITPEVRIQFIDSIDPVAVVNRYDGARDSALFYEYSSMDPATALTLDYEGDDNDDSSFGITPISFPRNDLTYMYLIYDDTTDRYVLYTHNHSGTALYRLADEL